MRLRKLITISLVLLLAAVFCVSALAAANTDPDTKFMSDLKTLEKYLTKNVDATDLGNKTIGYMKKNLSTMDIERLTRCLRTYLRCAETVPLRIMLESYAKQIVSDYYMSIYELAVYEGTSPDIAAGQVGFERGYLGAQYDTKTPSVTPEPKPCPPIPPCCYR